MPKSKRNQVVHLTKVKKKCKDHKANLMETLEKYVDKFEYVYLFDINSEKGQAMFALRLTLKETGHMWAGANGMTVASLRNIGTKQKINYADLVRQVKNRRGMYFTNLKPEKFLSLLEKHNMDHWIERMVGYAKLKLSEEEEEEKVVIENDDDDDDEQVEGFDSEEMSEWKRIKFIPIKKMKKKSKLKK